jgi:hypothetical protein
MPSLWSIVFTAFILLADSSIAYTQNAAGRPEAKCAITSQTRVYSNGRLSPETGDFVGWDMTIVEAPNSTATVTLYVYEGELNDEPIRVTGRLSGTRLTATGTWVQHLVEYPQRKAVEKTHSVSVDGTIDSSSFRGTIKIDGESADGQMSLKRVANLSGCNFRL